MDDMCIQSFLILYINVQLALKSFNDNCEFQIDYGIQNDKIIPRLHMLNTMKMLCDLI